MNDNNSATQAQNDAIGQLRAALAACEEAGLMQVAIRHGSDYAEFVTSVEYDESAGCPCVVLGIDDESEVELDYVDAT